MPRLMTLEKSYLNGKTCGECLNYEAQCSVFLGSDKGPLRPETDICYFSPSKFDIRWGWTLTKEELEVAKDYRRKR